MNAKSQSIPFAVDRNLKKSLVDQVADGLRLAISTGKYGPGEALPPVWKLAELLGVSVRVPRYAISKLVSEGLLTTRQGVGAVVLSRGDAVWRGRVLFIVWDHDETSYYMNTVCSEYRKRIVDAGYQYVCVTLSKRANGSVDCSPLDSVLRQSADFAVLRMDEPTVSQRLSKAGVPFAVFVSRIRPRVPCVGWVRCNYLAAVPDLIGLCRKAGVRTVLQIDGSERGPDILPAFRRAGFKADVLPVSRVSGYLPLESIERGAMESMLVRLEKGTDWLPDLFVSMDDFISFGVLTALLARGIRIPGDVRFVTLSNRGFGPVHPVSLARMEMDPVSDGERLARAVLLYLDGVGFPADLTVGPMFVSGDSFRV